MTLVGTYRGQAVPLYGRLLVLDPSMAGKDEPDLRRALEDADVAIVGGGRWQIAINAGQDTAAITVTIQLWDALPDHPPGNDWEGPRALTIESPQGALILENISSGPIPLEPNGAERITLPGGAGVYHVQAWHSGREQAATAITELWDADEVDEYIAAAFTTLAGIEQYLLQIWPHQS
jgi:hypothetical protein